MNQALQRTNEEILRLEKLVEKMENDGNYDAGVYKELDELYDKKEALEANAEAMNNNTEEE